MNLVGFDGKNGEEVDGNFISIYNPDTDRYEYYVQRLIGVEIENEYAPLKGRCWVPYINNVKQDWDMIVEENKHIRY